MKKNEKYITRYEGLSGGYLFNWVMRQKGLTMGEKVCYARMWQYYYLTGQCYPHQETLAKEIGRSASTTREYLKGLVKKKLVAKRRVGKKVY